MIDPTTEELIERLMAKGYKASRSQLTDLVRRGLVAGPYRLARRDGNRGSERRWHASAVTAIEAILRLRDEGVAYETIEQRIHRPAIGASRRQRLSLTAWMRADRAKQLENAAEALGLSVVGLLQLGAALVHEGPVRRAIEAEVDLVEAVGSTSHKPAPADRTFLIWATAGIGFFVTWRELADAELPEENTLQRAYYVWRVIQDGRVPSGALAALNIKVEVITRSATEMGQLTTFGGSVRLFRPSPEVAGNRELCRQLAMELDAALVTGEGHDFDHHGGAQALGQVADWYILA